MNPLDGLLGGLAKPKMRFCPCCGQKLSLMTDGEWHSWLKSVHDKLLEDNKPELAEALARFTAALELDA